MELQEGNIVKELAKEGENCKFSLLAYLGRCNLELALTCFEKAGGEAAAGLGRKEKE